MDYSKFQVAVIELANEGTRLTTANVVARLRVEPKEADQLLERMARDGRLELDVDEESGVIFYEVRGLTPKSGGLASLRSLGSAGAIAKVGTAIALGKSRGPGPLPPSLRRSVPLGVVLGAVLPGIGLAYTAPWAVVAAASVVVIVGFKLLAIIPIFAGFLSMSFLAVCAVASAILGGLYTFNYNQLGKRSPLGDEPVSPKRLLARIKG